MLKFLAALIAMVTSWFSVHQANGPVFVPQPLTEEVTTEGTCTFTFAFDQPSLTAHGEGENVPANLLLQRTLNLTDWGEVRRAWLDHCHQIQAELADPTRTDDYDLTVQQTYGQNGISGWAMHHVTFLEGMNGDYGTDYLVLDDKTGQPISWADMLPASQQQQAAAFIEQYALSPEVSGLQYSDSGLIDGTILPPTGFLQFMQIGYRDEGLAVYGYLPEVLGNLPLDVTVPWLLLEDYDFIGR